MKVTDITPGLTLEGLEPDRVCSVVAVTPLSADAIQVYYKLPDGTLRERLLAASDSESINVAVSKRPWAFDGSPESFQLACEASFVNFGNSYAFEKRMRLFLLRREKTG